MQLLIGRDHRGAGEATSPREAEETKVREVRPSVRPESERARMTWKDMKVCQTHGLNSQSDCMSCQIAIDWVIWRQFCSCGAPAVGYVCNPGDAPLQFYCDEHFPVMPKASVPA